MLSYHNPDAERILKSQFTDAPMNGIGHRKRNALSHG